MQEEVTGHQQHEPTIKPLWDNLKGAERMRFLYESRNSLAYTCMLYPRLL